MFQIQLQLRSDSVDDDDDDDHELQYLQSTIDTKLSYVKVHTPKLQRKAKSHLLLHIVRMTNSIYKSVWNACGNLECNANGRPV